MGQWQDPQELKQAITNLIDKEVRKANKIAEEALYLCDSIDSCHSCMRLNEEWQKTYNKLEKRLAELKSKWSEE